MNILMATANWYPSGGDWTYVNSVSNLYEANGHSIIPFAMKDSRNIPTPFEKYFLDNIDYKDLNKEKSLSTGLQVLKRSIYSKESVRKLEWLLDENRVDIAQLNNIHNIHTPSIIPVLKKRGIPVVWRILDYKLVCPNRTFLSNGEICESCHKHKYYNCVVKKCKKGSVLASMVAALESYTYAILPFYKKIDRFLFQSEFTRDIYVKYGFDPAKATIIENPYDASDAVPKYGGALGGGYILYFGRISPEKGMVTLYEAMRKIPHIQLKVVGDGPELEPGKTYTKENGINNIEFLGPKWGKELEGVLSNCDFVVLPSEWYDPSPYVILQSFSYGKPVLASRIGGIQDMIKDNETGMLVEPRNPQALAQEIDSLFARKDVLGRMGINARRMLEEKYSRERYYKETIGLFENLLTKQLQ